VDQQRILFQHRAFVAHAFGIGHGGHADAVRLGFGQQLAALHLGFTVNDFGFGHGFGVFHGRLFVGFGFELGLLDLLLLQGQRVLHGVRLGFGLQHANLGFALGPFHLLGLGGFGFKFRDSDLLLLNFRLHTHLIVLL